VARITFWFAILPVLVYYRATGFKIQHL